MINDKLISEEEEYWFKRNMAQLIHMLQYDPNDGHIFQTIVAAFNEWHKEVTLSPIEAIRLCQRLTAMGRPLPFPVRPQPPYRFEDVKQLSRDDPVVAGTLHLGEARGWSREEILATCVFELSGMLVGTRKALYERTIRSPGQRWLVKAGDELPNPIVTKIPEDEPLTTFYESLGDMDLVTVLKQAREIEDQTSVHLILKILGQRGRGLVHTAEKENEGDATNNE